MKPTYFISDLHFGAPRGTGQSALLTFLKSIRGNADAIYLVGDVFDFWLGYRHVIFSATFPLLRVLAELVESGTRVTIFSGNHDPDPGDFFQSLGIEVQEGPLSLHLNGHHVWLEHGDLIDPRSLFQRFICRTVRHPSTRWIARLLHPDRAWSLGMWYGQKTEEYTEPIPQGLLEEYFEDRIAHGYDAVIIGHYHRAVRYEKRLGQGTAYFFALGDWISQCTYLKFDGEFRLYRVTTQGVAQELSNGDHAP